MKCLQSNKEKIIIKKIALSALKEDLSSRGDITSSAVIPENTRSSFKLVVNEDAILAGINVFKEVFLILDKNIKIKSNFTDGSRIKKNQTVVTLTGNTQAILKGERSALNFIGHLSGIATLTNKLVKLLKHTNVILLDTRKTTPGLRHLEKEAVLAGGGKNHRFNLSEMVLIKDNHIDLAGGIKKAFSKIYKAYGHKYKIEIEVRNLKELNEAIFCKPGIIMFDNWKLKDLKAAVKIVPADILTEASGMISMDNIKAYAEAGVNYISTSYMIKNSKWVDFSLGAIRR